MHTPRLISTERKTALVADDITDIRKMLCDILMSLGLEIDQAVDGTEAVIMSAKKTYDLIIMDIDMPILNGIEATREIRKAGNKAHIIGFVGTYLYSKNDCRESGMDAIFEKPNEIRNLMEHVENRFR